MIHQVGMSYFMAAEPKFGYVFLIKSNKVQIVSSVDGSLIKEFRLHNIRKISISPDGSYAAFAFDNPSSISVYKLGGEFPLVFRRRFSATHYAIAEFYNNDTLIAAAGNSVYQITISQAKTCVLYAASEYAISNSLVCNQGVVLASFNFSTIQWEPPFIITLGVILENSTKIVCEYQFDQRYKNMLEYGRIDWVYFHKKNEIVIGKSGPLYSVFIAKIENKIILPPEVHRSYDKVRWSFSSQKHHNYGILYEQNNSDIITIENAVLDEPLYNYEFDYNSVAYPSFSEYSRFLLVPQRKKSSIIPF